MAPSSSGAILSMSAWFSRLNAQQQGRRDLGQEKAKRPASSVSNSQWCKFFHWTFYEHITPSYCKFHLSLYKQQTNKAGWVPRGPESQWKCFVSKCLRHKNSPLLFGCIIKSVSMFYVCLVNQPVEPLLLNLMSSNFNFTGSKQTSNIFIPFMME